MIYNLYPPYKSHNTYTIIVWKVSRYTSVFNGFEPRENRTHKHGLMSISTRSFPNNSVTRLFTFLSLSRVWCDRAHVSKFKLVFPGKGTRVCWRRILLLRQSLINQWNYVIIHTRTRANKCITAPQDVLTVDINRTLADAADDQIMSVHCHGYTL